MLRYFPVLFIKTAAGQLQIEWVWEHGQLKLGAVLQAFSKQYMGLLANSIAATSSAHRAAAAQLRIEVAGELAGLYERMYGTIYGTSSLTFIYDSLTLLSPSSP